METGQSEIETLLSTNVYGRGEEVLIDSKCAVCKLLHSRVQPPRAWKISIGFILFDLSTYTDRYETLIVNLCEYHLLTIPRIITEQCFGSERYKVKLTSGQSALQFAIRVSINPQSFSWEPSYKKRLGFIYRIFQRKSCIRHPDKRDTAAIKLNVLLSKPGDCEHQHKVITGMFPICDDCCAIIQKINKSIIRAACYSQAKHILIHRIEEVINPLHNAQLMTTFNFPDEIVVTDMIS